MIRIGIGDIRLQQLDRAAIKKAYETLATTPRKELKEGEAPKDDLLQDLFFPTASLGGIRLLA